jgi:hypothetical protein
LQPVILAESRTVSRAPAYYILWVRGFRAPTISGREFNLFNLLRRHFRATPFCRQALSRRGSGDRNASVQTPTVGPAISAGTAL